MYATKLKDEADTVAGQAIVNAWVKQRIPDFKELTGLDLHAYFEFEEDKALFNVEGWKWYPDYPEVKALENIFKEFSETFCAEPASGKQYDCAYAIEFMRFGEDYTDIEIKMNGNAQYRLELYRNITLD
jgi:hypothetical protein